MATSGRKATTKLTNDALAFLTERHLAMLTTLRSDQSPHVVAVGFTFDPKTHIARVITTGGAPRRRSTPTSAVSPCSARSTARGGFPWRARPSSTPTSTPFATPNCGTPSATARHDPTETCGDRGACRAGAGFVGSAGPRRGLSLQAAPDPTGTTTSSCGRLFTDNAPVGGDDHNVLDAGAPTPPAK